MVCAKINAAGAAPVWRKSISGISGAATQEGRVPFKDRSDAGRRLAAALAHYRDQHPVILALPRGGVPVAAEVATALSAPLDLILVRKIGVPFQPELAMGAVVDGSSPLIVRNEEIVRLARIDEEVVEILRRFPVKHPMLVAGASGIN
jgi:hypothetical protein